MQASAVSRGTNISVIGYTDGCGTAEYTRSLARQRAQAVVSIARQSAPNANFRIIVAGETSGAHSSASRRVDVVIHTRSALQTRIERVAADVYLIDASGSMWGGWRRLVAPVLTRLLLGLGCGHCWLGLG